MHLCGPSFLLFPAEGNRDSWGIGWGEGGEGSCLVGNVNEAKQQRRKHTWGGRGEGGGRCVWLFFALKGKTALGSGGLFGGSSSAEFALLFTELQVQHREAPRAGEGRGTGFLYGASGPLSGRRGAGSVCAAGATHHCGCSCCTEFAGALYAVSHPLNPAPRPHRGPPSLPSSLPPETWVAAGAGLRALSGGQPLHIPE